MNRRQALLGLAAAAALATAIAADAATYDFTGALGTKLSTLGWTLLGGDDALELNGAGVLRKIASSSVKGLYVEGGAGNTTQTIDADIAVSGTTYQGVLCTWNNGLEGYFLRRSSTTTLRLMRYVGGGLQSNLISSIAVGSGTIRLEAVVGANSTVIKVYENGVQVGATITDSTVNRLTTGRVGLAYETTSSVGTVTDNVVTAASGGTTGTGALTSTTVRFGRATPALNGAIRAYRAGLGLLASGSVGTWQFDRTAGNAAIWPTQVTSGYTPTPQVALTDADAGTTATYSITIDGVLKAQTLTLSVQSIVEATAAQTVASQFDINRLSKTALGGYIVEFPDGCADAFGDYANQPATFVGFSIHTGTFTVQCQPTPTKGIPAVLVSGSQRIIFDKMLILNALPATGSFGGWDGVSGGWSNTQNRGLFTLDTSVGVCDSITLKRSTVMGPVAAFADKSRWYTGINIQGSSSTLSAKHTNIVIGATAADAGVWTPNYTSLLADTPPMSDGNLIRRVKDGITGGNIQFMTFRGNLVHDFCSNASFLGGKQLQDINSWDNCFIDGWTNPADLNDHPDFFQWGSTGASADYQRIDCRRIVLLVVSADKHSQGPFFNDTTFNASGASGPLIDGSSTQRLTGYVLTDCKLWNVYYNCGSTIGVVLDIGTGWDVRNTTVVRGKGSGLLSAQVDPTTRGSAHTENVSGTVHQPTGTADRLATHGITMPGMTVTNSIIYNDTKGATGLSGPPGQNETNRIAYYADFFNDPGAADYVAQGYPKVNGTLKLGDGSYAGCFYPDGTFATASAFGAAAPTAYTMSGPSTDNTGSPATITFTLNSIATADVVITPAKSGVTGAFSPATVTIPIGSISGTTQFTPTSAGTAVISASDDHSLTDPANINIAVSDPTPGATLLTQSLSSAVIRIGQSVIVTYTADQVADLAITVTPACGLAGTFAPTAPVIPVGQTQTTTSFTPSVVGTGNLTCTNNRSLTNPGAAALQVVTSAFTKGQLRKLHIR